MAHKKRISLSRFLLDMIFIVPNIMSIVSNMISLLGLEARLAGRSLLLILFFSLLGASLLAISWMCLLGMLFLYFVSLQWTSLFSLFVVFLINSIFLLVIAVVISSLKRNFSFEGTREKCRALCRTCGDL